MPKHLNMLQSRTPPEALHRFRKWKCHAKGSGFSEVSLILIRDRTRYRHVSSVLVCHSTL